MPNYGDWPLLWYYMGAGNPACCLDQFQLLAWSGEGKILACELQDEAADFLQQSH